MASLKFCPQSLVLVCAVDDEHKQAFHDKIANTVVIDYKPS
ncbi:hypothetical protein [Wolbachia endosymbiont (group A) of Trypoxylon clavicerum]